MNSQCVPQADFTQLLKRAAFAIGTHDGATPQICVVNVDIFRRDVEVTAHHNIVRLFFRDAISQAVIPMQFVFVGWGTDRLAVRRINRKNTETTDGCCNHARLRIDHFIAQRRTHIAQLDFRQDRDAVVRFFAVISRVITGGLQTKRRKLIVGAFCLLQANSVRLCRLQPGE